MKIFNAFLIVVISAILLLLPVPAAIKDFATVAHVNTSNSTTLPAVTAANITFSDALYDNNTAYISVVSNLNTDVPNIASYNSTIRTLTVDGLTENATRTLTATYSVYSLPFGGAVMKFVGIIPFFWLVICFAFMVIGIVAVFI